MRNGPGAARTILLLHNISARPSKQHLMVRTVLKVYGAWLLFFVSARTNERHLPCGTSSTSLPSACRPVPVPITLPLLEKARPVRCACALWGAKVSGSHTDLLTPWYDEGRRERA